MCHGVCIFEHFPNLVLFLKESYLGSGETVQQLKAHAELPGLVPSTHVKQLAIIGAASSKGPGASGPLPTQTH